MLHKVQSELCKRMITALALILATAIPAVGPDAQRAHACPLGSDCPPGTPWYPKARSYESQGAVFVDVHWTNTATDERLVAFEIHRRELRGDAWVDISPDVVDIIRDPPKYYPCIVHCYTAPPVPDYPPPKIGPASKPMGGPERLLTSYTFSGLRPGSEQSFRVRAKNLETGKVSEWSEEVFASVGFPSFSTKPITPNPNPPPGPLILGTSFKDKGVELTWMFDIEPPTSFRVYRDGKVVDNQSMTPSFVIEDVHPSPWSPPSAPPSGLVEPPMYQTGVYVSTDVFQYSLSGQYAYKVCPVFGTGIPIEGTCSGIVRTPVGPQGLSGSWEQNGAQLTWAYDVNPPTSFRIFRDNKIVANPTLAPDWVNEDVHPNPWSVPSAPSSVLAEPTVYRTGIYVYTDVFESPPFSTYSYKVCPVFGAEIQAEGTCSQSVAVSNYGLERVERPEVPPNPVIVGPGE